MGWPARQPKAAAARPPRGLPLPGEPRDRAGGSPLGARRAARALLVLAGALVGVGCGKTLSEDDCRRIGEAMRAAWAAEAKRSGPAEPGSSGKAAVVIASEGERLSSEWTSDCKRELAGSEVDPGEVDCLTRAKTLDEIRRCSAP
ncbi:hypothetical protein [Sorangium sp. So ce385]|uniref:hypothetical protein n=1 Tax=Sorangium sp. So ce385 TaxID=3133308 RepID=UPI003F5BBC80